MRVLETAGLCGLYVLGCGAVLLAVVCAFGVRASRGALLEIAAVVLWWAIAIAGTFAVFLVI